MNKRQAYLDLQEKHRKELEAFPIAYAFDREQLKMALGKLGAKKEEVVTVFGHGDIVKKENAPKLIAMLKSHTKEIHKMLEEDEEFAEEAFLYEMDNHEYAINWSADEDTLAAFSLTKDDIPRMGLTAAYNRARNRHMKHAQEWEMI